MPQQLDLARLINESSCRREALSVRRRLHVYSRGEADDALYIIEAGVVASVVATADGGQGVAAIAVQGEVFGELCLCQGVTRRDTALVLQDARLMRIPAAAVSLQSADTALVTALIQHMVSRLLKGQANLASLVSMNAEQRLANLLVDLAQRFEMRPTNGGFAQPMLTQGELAAAIGTTRCRVGQFLKRFQMHRLIKPNPDGSLWVDQRALLSYAEDCVVQRRRSVHRAVDPGVTAAPGEPGRKIAGPDFEPGRSEELQCKGDRR